MSCRPGVAALVVVACAKIAAAEPPAIRDGTDQFDWSTAAAPPVQSAPLVTPAAPYNTIYLNRCKNGCVVTRDTTSNSIADTWPYAAGASQVNLTAFPFNDATWTAVVACVKDVFSPYQVQIVETDPGSTDHFEIMLAGTPAQLGYNSDVGGVAPPGCHGQYLDDALVFDFAAVWSFGSSTCNTACIENICTTAAQEIGHTWSDMDHVIDNKDPMTYYSYSKRKYFQDSVDQCGSDCVAGTGPGGVTCSGTNNQSHVCRCTGSTSQTQNSHQIIKNLFGLGPGTPPTVKITSPKYGASVDPSFAVAVDATDDSGIVTKVELKVDNVVVGTLMSAPYVFSAPATLADGVHHVEAVAYDPHNTPGSAKIDVNIGPPCQDASDCPNATDVCVGGHCVPGPDETGGLGNTCTQPTDCLSNQCASDGTDMYCVEACTPGQCPNGFGCLDDGTNAGTGYCWPGYDDSSGCGCQSNRPGGPLTLLLLIAVGVFTCRRRRR